MSMHRHAPTSRREKLGLSLAGGGFRASLFHVGVLRFLAQHDLLRYVEVLSTVSGGSLVGALYVMKLKAVMESAAASPPPSGTGEGCPKPIALAREKYVHIVAEVEQSVRQVVAKNLRMRLLLNPAQLLFTWLGARTLGDGMAKWLDRHLFGQTDSKRPRLLDLRLCGDLVSQFGGTENYNRAALWSESQGQGAAVTRLILNTTCLNSGGRFWFSHAEFGDWHLGYVRYADVRDELWPYKWLLQEVYRRLPDQFDGESGLIKSLKEQHGRKFHSGAQESRGSSEANEKDLQWEGIGKRLRNVWPLLRWWRREGPAEVLDAWHGTASLTARLAAVRRRDEQQPLASAAQKWQGVDPQPSVLELAGLLRNSEMGLLRRLKNFAWLLKVGRLRQSAALSHSGVSVVVDDGMSDAELAVGFVDALRPLDERWVGWLDLRAQPSPLFDPSRPALPGQRLRLHDWAEALMNLVIDLYQIRCALFMSPHVLQEWQLQPLSSIVAASAAFPPVFPPQVLSTLVDDRTVRRLGLTDGGVFDNLGTTALLDEQCTMVISSDPGGLFDSRMQKVSVGRAGLMSRLATLLGERPNQLFRHELRERRRMGEALAGGGPVPAPARDFLQPRSLSALSSFRIVRTRDLDDPESLGRLLADIRTDLDVFGEIEQDALVLQGEERARHHVMRRFGPGSGSPLEAVLSTPAAPPTPSMPLIKPIQAAEHPVLREARHRFLRIFRLNPWVLLVAGGVSLLMNSGLASSLRDMISIEGGGRFATLAQLANDGWTLGSGLLGQIPGQWPGLLPRLWELLHAWLLPALFLCMGAVWGLQLLWERHFRLMWRSWVRTPVPGGAKERVQWLWSGLRSRVPTLLRRMRVPFNAALYLGCFGLLPSAWWWVLLLPWLLAVSLFTAGLLAVKVLTPAYLRVTRRVRAE